MVLTDVLRGRNVNPSGAVEKAGVVRSLKELKRGESAMIVGIVGLADADVARRLYDLGFAPGRRVEVVRSSPMGSPTVYRVAECEMALRRAQAERIMVEAA